MKMMKRLSGIVLSLVLMLGMMPGMSLTVYAAYDAEETISTVSPDGYSHIDYTFEGTNCSVTASRVFKEEQGTAMWDFPVTFNAISGYTIQKIEFNATNDRGSLTSTKGTISKTGNEYTITGINADSFSMDSKGGYIQFKSVKVSLSMDAVAVDSVNLSPNTVQTIDAGGKVSFAATVAPENATDKKVKWSVTGDAVKLYSDEACNTEVGADVTETLTVYAKGISAGSATVTVTSAADGEKKASCEVTVNKDEPNIKDEADASAAENKYEVNITDASVSKAEVDGWGDLDKTSTGATYRMEIKEASSGSEVSTIDTYANRMYEKANGNFTKKFLDFSIIKREASGVESNIHETGGNAMKVTFTITGDSNICSPVIWRYHGGDATAFTKVDETSASGEDCTFSVEGEGSNTATFHVYTSEFSTYAVTYAPTPVTLNNNYKAAAAAGGGGGSSSGGTDGVIRVDGIVSGGMAVSQAAGNNPAAGTAANGMQTDGTGLQAGATVNGGAVNDAAGVAAANGKANPKSNGKTNPAAGASDETAPKMGDPMDDVVPILYILAMSGLLLLAQRRRR